MFSPAVPESTDSLKTSYLSRENTYRLVIVDFEVEGVRYALTADAGRSMVDFFFRFTISITPWAHERFPARIIQLHSGLEVKKNDF